ncbi:MAG: lipocalin family protein [Spirochaetaceae bacterium]
MTRKRTLIPAPLAVLAVLAIILIGGCSIFPLGNPFVGTWETENPFNETVVTTRFTSDMTFTERWTDLDGVEQTDTGTYEYDDEIVTLSYDDGESYDYFYEFKQDGDTMVLTLTEGLSLSLSYTRVE